MSCTSNVHFAKPMLEKLEDRALLSFLLSGNAVSQLATPLNNMVSDMKSAASDLKTQFNIIQTQTPPGTGPLGLTFNGAEQVTGKMIADWQRILSDQAAVKTLSSNYQTAIGIIALAEFQEGDALDLIILDFGSLIGVHPLASLTSIVNQADSIATDSTLLNIVGQNLHTVNSYVDSTLPISQEVVTPSF